MKIQGNSDLLGRVRVEPPASPGTPAPIRFQDLLKRSLSPTPASDATPAAGGAVSVQFRPADPSAAGSVMERLEGFLELLEEYRSKLADPRVSLKGLDSVVRSLEQGRDALSPLLGTLPEADGLKDMLNQALVTTEMEIMRFRRGDYLPA